MIGMAWPFEAGWIDQSFQIWESFLLLPQSTKVPPRSQSIKIHQRPPRSTKDQGCSQRALDRLSGLRSRTMSLVRNSIRILLFFSTFGASPSASLESHLISASLPALPDSSRFPPKNMSTPQVSPQVGPNRQARQFVNFFQIPGTHHYPQPPT